MKLSICIVNWEGGEVFKKCLESITSNCQEIKLTDYEIIVVDNHSNYLDKQFLKKFNKLKLYINKKTYCFPKPQTNQ